MAFWTVNSVVEHFAYLPRLICAISEVGQGQLLGLVGKFSEPCSARVSVKNFPGVSLSEAKQTIDNRFAGFYRYIRIRLGRLAKWAKRLIIFLWDSSLKTECKMGD